MAIKIANQTVIDDSRRLVNVSEIRVALGAGNSIDITVQPGFPHNVEWPTPPQ